MNVTRAPRGDFYIVTHNGLAVFDRCRANAIHRLAALIWRMPRRPYVEESVANVRTRTAIHRSNTQ